jgi:phosphate acetyltransferase
MKFIDSIFEKLRRHPKRIVFPEGTEPRTLRAAESFVHEKLGPAIVLGKRDAVEKAAREACVKLDRIHIIDPETADDLELFCKRLEKLKRYRDLGKEATREMMLKPHYFAAMMIQYGQADGLVGGASVYPGTLFRPLIQLVKPLPGIETISSCTVIEVPDSKLGENGVFFFSDCAVIPQPTVNQLAAIAIETGTICRQLTGIKPRVALLSFSTKAATKLPGPERVAAAAAKAKQRVDAERLEMEIDGELQLDTAIMPELAKLKGATSAVAGRANVLIFPDLQSGNIGVKLVQHLANAEAYGQLLLGLSRPCGSVSRGATAEEILGVAAIIGLQAIEYRKLYPPT